MRRAYVAPAARVRSNAFAFSLPPKSVGSSIAVARGAVAGVEYVRWRPAAPATEVDTPTTRKMATNAARFRAVCPTSRTLSATLAGGAEICRLLTPIDQP